VDQIRALRLRLRWGPHRLAPVVGSPRSTVYAVLRREGLTRHTGLGYEVVHAAIDDASRLGFVQILPDRRGPTCAAFLLEAATFFAEQGICVERVMTDRDSSYRRSRAFKTAVQNLGVGPKMTRPYRPQTNGKVERFIQTLLREWAYVRAYRTNEERHAALPKWLHYYNQHRPHTALGGRAPAAMSVNNVCGNHS
jgi:transposase InsO family protein